ncbi:MAG: hypothetical protein JSS76_07040 [Bacteroidetes bacterium]|nr:hypothetical protein [Bacteroidota bacterium]MBS1684490.1 hypothetical protein [Bacteroidota bacterium]
MVTIIYNGKIRKVHEAVDRANALLADDMFYHAISARGTFDMADIPAVQVAELIRTTDLSMRLITYIGSPRVHGYDDRDNPDLIHLNLFRADWTLSGIVNTMMHQMVHAVNDVHRQYNFSHGDRTIEGKENTAPFWIGNHAEERIDAGTGLSQGMVHDAHPESLAIDTLD